VYVGSAYDEERKVDDEYEEVYEDSDVVVETELYDDSGALVEAELEYDSEAVVEDEL
jgi:hypothetical protein